MLCKQRSARALYVREGRGGGRKLFIALLYISRMATFEKGVKESAAKLDGSGLRIAIVHTRWNYALVDQMYKVVYDTLIKKHGVLPENIYTVCLYFRTWEWGDVHSMDHCFFSL